MKRKTKRRLARENPNWRLKVYDQKALLADNGPYVTQRGALVDAKELARRRAAVQGQRVVTIRTRAGRDSAYKTVDANGEATGFFAVPGAVPGTELRYNPKRRALKTGRRNPFVEAWEPTGPYAGYVGESARGLGGRFFQDETGRIRATFKDVNAAKKFLERLRDYRATEVTDVRTGHWPNGPFTYTIEADLPKVRTKARANTGTRANHHLAPGQRAAGEVRVVKPLGMRGKADYYIVEGHRLRAEGARRNGAGAKAPGVTSAEAYAHAQRHKAERDRYGKLTARTYTGGNIQSHEELGEWRHETAAKEWYKAARALELVGNEAWPVHPRVVNEAVRQAEKASAAAAAADAAYLAARAEAERLKAKFAARKNGRRTR